MENNEINPARFNNKRDLHQAADIVYSATTMLHLALGQCASCAAITGKDPYTEAQRKSLVKKFTSLIPLLGIAYKAYRDAAENAEGDD